MTYPHDRRSGRSGARSAHFAALAAAIAAFVGLGGCTGDSDGPVASVPADGSIEPVSGAVCVVTDATGLGGSPFNQLALDGANAAAAEFNLSATVLESGSDDDYATNIDSFVEQQCSLIVTVGPALADSTLAAANANPDQRFVLVDFAFDRQPANLATIRFDAREPAFLAGYLAAGVSDTEVVATFGGINIEAITDTMDAFANGVDVHNRVNGTAVEVLGWDGTNGLFAGNFDSFEDGETLATALVEQGADVIFPLAGRVGVGAAVYAANATDVLIVGSDTDAYEIDPALASVYLTSVLKHVDTAVLDVIEAIVIDAEPETEYVGTLDNGGVGLAPYHDQDGNVPDDLKQEIDELLAGIVAGDVRVG